MLEHFCAVFHISVVSVNAFGSLKIVRVARVAFGFGFN